MSEINALLQPETRNDSQDKRPFRLTFRQRAHNVVLRHHVLTWQDFYSCNKQIYWKEKDNDRRTCHLQPWWLQDSRIFNDEWLDVGMLHYLSWVSDPHPDWLHAWLKQTCQWEVVRQSLWQRNRDSDTRVHFFWLLIWILRGYYLWGNIPRNFSSICERYIKVQWASIRRSEHHPEEIWGSPLAPTYQQKPSNKARACVVIIKNKRSPVHCMDSMNLHLWKRTRFYFWPSRFAFRQHHIGTSKWHALTLLRVIRS